MDGRRRRAGGSARSSAATSRWTATGAGSGSSAPTTCWSTGAPSSAAPSGAAAAREAYERGETDEFIAPVLVGEEARIRPGDSVIAFNFRPDRMREITRALAEPGFDEIDRGGAPPVERYATMTEYEEGWTYPVAFAPEHPATTLPAVLASHGVRQLHVAETEKYAHVTYFFNGGDEQPCDGERRELVALAARRPDLRPQARDERAGGRGGVRRGVAQPTRPASGSSTSPTPTWSGTRA